MFFHERLNLLVSITVSIFNPLLLLRLTVLFIGVWYEIEAMLQIIRVRIVVGKQFIGPLIILSQN